MCDEIGPKQMLSLPMLFNDINAIRIRVKKSPAKKFPAIKSQKSDMICHKVSSEKVSKIINALIAF